MCSLKKLKYLRTLLSVCDCLSISVTVLCDMEKERTHEFLVLYHFVCDVSLDLCLLEYRFVELSFVLNI